MVHKTGTPQPRHHHEHTERPRPLMERAKARIAENAKRMAVRGGMLLAVGLLALVPSMKGVDLKPGMSYTIPNAAVREDLKNAEIRIRTSDGKWLTYLVKGDAEIITQDGKMISKGWPYPPPGFKGEQNLGYYGKLVFSITVARHPDGSVTITNSLKEPNADL